MGFTLIEEIDRRTVTALTNSVLETTVVKEGSVTDVVAKVGLFPLCPCIGLVGSCPVTLTATAFHIGAVERKSVAVLV